MPHTDHHPHGTLSWFDLSTPDPVAARAFYGALFGWEFTPEGPPETGYYTMALVNGRTAAGMGKQQQEGVPSTWSVYLAADDAAAVAARVPELGGSVVMPPMDVMGDGHMAIFADPGGAIFGVWQPGNHRGARVVHEPGAMEWAEVNTRDTAQVRDFYAALFGLSPQKVEGVAYFTMHLGEQNASWGILEMNERWEGIPSHWMPYFQVADVERAVREVPELGGKVHVPPFDTPHGRIAVLADPFGATFTVLTRPPGA